MNTERLLSVILVPLISEKSTRLGEKRNQYVFKVTTDASKTEVKMAVEMLFKVKVECVTILNVKGKVKRFRQMLGKRKDWRKAYVSLADGHEIDFNITE